MLRWLGTLLALIAPAAPVCAQAVNDTDWDDQAVENAIQRATAYLWSQWSGGHWTEVGQPGAKTGAGETPNYGGVTALCAYALLAAGESPKGAQMEKTLAWLSQVEMHGTYARAFRANAWAMLGRESPYRRNLQDDVQWLVDAADSRGAYNYFPPPVRTDPSGDPAAAPRYDNSNSQLAVLGVWAGVTAGIEVKPAYWKLVERHWVGDQNPDGGWAYTAGRPSYGSMSAAGLATMFICFDNIYQNEFITCRADTSYSPVVKGMKWLDANFSADANPGRNENHYYYYLYGVERVGLAGGYKYFGKQDWYKLGTLALLRRQDNNGSWNGTVNTAFALLFLARGRHPVLFNKLQYDGAWNSRPRDLANLTRWMSRTFERQINWQIVHLGVPVSEWHDAPVLYVSGAAAPNFSDADLDKLRAFVGQGGVIFSEAACSKPAFTLAMKNVYARLFPDYELRTLAADHPLFSQELHFPVSRTRGLLGISNGVRLLALHAPADVSGPWQQNYYSTETDVFRLAANIYLYVADKGILPPRGVARWPKQTNVQAERSIRVARIKYRGNWAPEPLAWERFALLMLNTRHVKVELSEPTEIEALDAARWPLAAMTGTTAVELTDGQRQALGKYLQAGGTLVVDAAGGSDAFADAMEAQIQKLLPGGEYALVAPGHTLYTKAGPPIEKVYYRRATKVSLTEPHRPRLRAVSLDGRLAVVFSRDDLTAGLVGYPCWGVHGYRPDSAFELMRNIVLYASGK